jgi:replicative DNA helicase
MEHIKKCIEKMKSEELLLSGFIELDKIIYSFEKSNLYILAGNPGIGKTAFGLNIVYNIAVLQKKKVLWFRMK